MNGDRENDLGFWVGTCCNP